MPALPSRPACPHVNTRRMICARHIENSSWRHEAYALPSLGGPTRRRDLAMRVHSGTQAGGTDEQLDTAEERRQDTARRGATRYALLSPGGRGEEGVRPERG